MIDPQPIDPLVLRFSDWRGTDLAAANARMSEFARMATSGDYVLRATRAGGGLGKSEVVDFEFTPISAAERQENPESGLYRVSFTTRDVSESWGKIQTVQKHFTRESYTRAFLHLLQVGFIWQLVPIKTIEIGEQANEQTN